MPVTTQNEYITTAELNYIAEGVLADLIKNEGEATLLDNVATPTLNLLLAKSAKGNNRGQTANGGIRYQVRGRRQQRIEWFDGVQKLTFQGDFQGTHLTFGIGKGHMGDLVPYEMLERMGIPVTYGETIREGAVPPRAVHVIINHVKENWKQHRAAFLLDLAIRAWTSNITDAPKCFLGYEDLFSVSTNSTGNIGTQSRADQRFRHQLVTGVTADTLRLALTQMGTTMADAAGGDGTKWDLCVVGDDVWDMAAGLYLGTSSVAGKYDLAFGKDEAQRLGGAFKIGLPTDAFVGPDGQMFVRDQTWREIDRTNSLAVPMAKRMALINTGHLDFHVEKHLEKLSHPMPYDQLVAFTSLFGSYVLGTDKPSTQGWLVKS